MQQAQAHFDVGEYEAALALWLPLARQGVARAQGSLGACLVGGLGVEADAVTGVKWLQAAATQGDAQSQRNLAHAYFKGDGAPASEFDAEFWYRRAAEQGDAEAQDMLSWMLASSDRRAPDYAQALAEKAAAQGVAASMTRIGMLYHNALGLARDMDRAVVWWTKAAYLNDGDAQAMLGAAHCIGQGVPRDPVQAYAWLRRARRNQSKLAENFIYAARVSLDDEQIARAESLADQPLDPGGAS